MNYKILRGFCLGGGIDVVPGETRNDIPEHMKQRLIQQGKIAVIGAVQDSSALLTQIAVAPDLDTLEKLLSEDPEIITAYEKRVDQLTKPARGKK